MSKSSAIATLSPLQKAAVLINSLEMRAADVLLEQMPAAQANRVREALLQLEDVPAEIQEAVIGEFLQNGGKLPEPAADDNLGVELALSTTIVPPEPPVKSQRGHSSIAVEFQFLADASPALLADFLRQEHPQTVAVVLAHLDPDQAARVLERLPAELSTESLARMARLHHLSQEILADLAEEIRLQLMPRMEEERRPQGLAGASAVLSALNDPLRKQMLGQLAHRDQSLVRQLGYLDASALPRTPTTSPLPPVSATQAAKLTTSEPVATPQHVDRPRAASDYRFADLARLSDASLKRIFAQAEPQVVILALTGADEQFIERIVRQLSGREATALRQRLNHPGPLRLRDVDAAQQELADIAAELLPPKHLSLQS